MPEVPDAVVVQYNPVLNFFKFLDRFRRCLYCLMEAEMMWSHEKIEPCEGKI